MTTSLDLNERLRKTNLGIYFVDVINGCLKYVIFLPVTDFLKLADIKTLKLDRLDKTSVFGGYYNTSKKTVNYFTCLIAEIDFSDQDEANLIMYL